MPALVGRHGRRRRRNAVEQVTALRSEVSGGLSPVYSPVFLPIQDRRALAGPGRASSPWVASGRIVALSAPQDALRHGPSAASGTEGEAGS